MNKPPFLTWRDLPENGRPIAGVLEAPFWFYSGHRVPELVMHFTPTNALPGAARPEARPFALRVSGEGWIRLEHQIGRDVTAWPGQAIEIFRAFKKGNHYIGIGGSL